MKRPPGALEELDALYATAQGRALLRRVAELEDPEWVRELDELVTSIRDRLPEFSQTEWAPLPAWVRLQVLDTWTRWVHGQATTCAHWPVVERPELVAAALWRPGLVTCIDCGVFMFRLTGAADATCDGCGHVCAGPDAGDPIHPCVLQFGPMLLSWGACQECRPPGQVSPTGFKLARLSGVGRRRGPR